MTVGAESTEVDMAEIVIDVIAHRDLTVDNLARLRRLFDAEYQQDFGDWDPTMREVSDWATASWIVQPRS